MRMCSVDVDVGANTGKVLPHSSPLHLMSISVLIPAAHRFFADMKPWIGNHLPGLSVFVQK